MDIDILIHMANHIGEFFEPQPVRSEALAGIAEHIRKFWEPRMRTQLMDALDRGEASSLLPVVAEAIAAHRTELQPVI